MKNKKRWLALGLVGIMTLGCFAGCGSKEKKTEVTGLAAKDLYII